MALRDITFRGILEGYKFSQKALDTTIPNGGTVTLSFCGEHDGEYLEARADNGVLNGKATIKNAYNQVLFELHIENARSLVSTSNGRMGVFEERDFLRIASDKDMGVNMT